MRTYNNQKKHKSKYIHVPSILKATNNYKSDTQNFVPHLWKNCDSLHLQETSWNILKAKGFKFHVKNSIQTLPFQF